MIQTYKEGVTPEEIVQRYPAASLVDVYATITYYLQHRSEVETYLDEEHRQSDELREQHEIAGLRERLLARLSTAKRPSPVPLALMSYSHTPHFFSGTRIPLNLP